MTDRNMGKRPPAEMTDPLVTRLEFRGFRGFWGCLVTHFGENGSTGVKWVTSVAGEGDQMGDQTDQVAGYFANYLSSRLAKTLGASPTGHRRQKHVLSAATYVPFFRCLIAFPCGTSMEVDTAVLPSLLNPHDLLIGRDILATCRVFALQFRLRLVRCAENVAEHPLKFRSLRWVGFCLCHLGDSDGQIRSRIRHARRGRRRLAQEQCSALSRAFHPASVDVASGTPARRSWTCCRFGGLTQIR